MSLVNFSYIKNIKAREKIGNLIVEKEHANTYKVSMDGIPLVVGDSERVYSYLKILGLVV